MATSLETGAGTDPLAGTRAAFADAVDAAPAGAEELWLRFAGRPVHLRVAGPELARQLAHCFEVQIGERPAGPSVDLTISAWDRAHTGVGCPGVPYAPDATDVLGPGLVTRYGGGRVLRYERPEAVKALDRCTQELFVCVGDAGRAGLSERSKPFPHLLATWYLDHGVHVLHAGLVARRGRGVLLGGGAGSGKSTTALAAALAGFDLLGDDAVGTDLAADCIRAHACYSTVRFDDGVLARLPELGGRVVPATIPADRGKHLASVIDVLGRRPDPVASLEAVVVPTVAGTGPTQLSEASPAETLRALAPSTLLRGLGAGSAGLAHLAELVRRLPCHALSVGASLDDVAGRLDDLLAGLGR